MEGPPKKVPKVCIVEATRQFLHNFLQVSTSQACIDACPFMEAQTIENTREKDVTIIAPDDEEVEADDAQDEFASEPSCTASGVQHARTALHCKTIRLLPVHP